MRYCIRKWIGGSFGVSHVLTRSNEDEEEARSKKKKNAKKNAWFEMRDAFANPHLISLEWCQCVLQSQCIDECNEQPFKKLKQIPVQRFFLFFHSIFPMISIHADASAARTIRQFHRFHKPSIWRARIFSSSLSNWFVHGYCVQQLHRHHRSQYKSGCKVFSYRTHLKQLCTHFGKWLCRIPMSLLLLAFVGVHITWRSGECNSLF